ncbi:MAG TPA: ABC transporter ATP-binding protein [Terriglobales bacterium]|nr:ABC transporter ATP-binding protein [Terriglobales bacterium]
MDKIIEVTNLTKRYGPVTAVKDVSFYVEQGQLFSFLGPNGAGKSTTINILCTLLAFDGGACEIGGHDLRREGEEIRNIIGIVFQDHVLDDLLTVRENLTVRAGLYTGDRAAIKTAVYEAAQAAELADILDRPYGKLSGGQRRRADIARALLFKPRILFLDEPTTGLDPQTRKNIWQTVKRLQAEWGMTVFLTTHYMEEAADSDYVVVIDHGEIAAKGRPETLRTEYASDTLRLYPADEAGLCDALESMQVGFEAYAGQVVVKLPQTMAALPVLAAAKPYISGFQVLQGSMDDAFIGITGGGLRE